MAIAINTSQNVLLEYEPASIGDRILATVIDYVVIAGWVLLTAILPAALLGRSGLNQPIGIVYYLVVVGLPIIFYDFLCEWLLNGQSLGKIAMKIRVVMLDGSQPGIGAYLLRWLLRLIDTRIFSGLVAVICVAANGKGQRLGDMAAGTTVIRLKPKVNLGDITYTQLPDDYRVTFPQAAQLSDQDIQVIREVIQRGSSEAIVRAAEKIKDVLSITTSLDSYQLLNAVVNDYQYLAMQD